MKGGREEERKEEGERGRYGKKIALPPRKYHAGNTKIATLSYSFGGDTIKVGNNNNNNTTTALFLTISLK